MQTTKNAMSVGGPSIWNNIANKSQKFSIQSSVKRKNRGNASCVREWNPILLANFPKITLTSFMTEVVTI